jgi:hypothetical protein
VGKTRRHDWKFEIKTISRGFAKPFFALPIALLRWQWLQALTIVKKHRAIICRVCKPFALLHWQWLQALTIVTKHQAIIGRAVTKGAFFHDWQGASTLANVKKGWGT